MLIQTPFTEEVTFDIEEWEIKISQSENEGQTFQLLTIRYKIVYISLQ